MKTPRQIQDERYIAMLKREAGPELLALLDDPALTDFMRNADGRCWVATHSRGMYEANFTLTDTQVEALIGTHGVIAGQIVPS